MDIAMIFLFAILGLAGGGICRIRTNTYFNSGSLFCFIWGAVGAFSNTGLYGLYLPSTVVNIAMLIGIISFSVVYCAFSHNRKIDALCIKDMKCDARYKLVYLVNGIVFVYIMPFFVRALIIIRTQGFVYLRSIAGLESGEIGTTSLSNLILQAICYPAIIATFIIGCILLFQGNKKSKKILLLSLANMILYCLTNAARNGFVILIIIFILCYLKYYRVQRKAKVQVLSGKERILSIFLIVVCIVIVLWISTERSSEENSIVRTMYLYFFGGPVYLSQLLEELMSYEINSTFLFGTSTFGFLWNIFALFFNRIGFSLINSDFIINSTLAYRSLVVGTGVKLNAMSTVFFPFLMDWGYIGIVVGPILLAIFSYYIDKKAYWNNTIRWHAIEAFWLYTIYRTVFKWDGISVSFFFVLFFIVLFTKKGVVNED